MRILHVATLVTPDGAYGGPIRVAINQLRELQSRGHQVALAAGYSGFTEPRPTSLAGVPVNLFRVRRLIPYVGFAGLTSPELTRWVQTQTQSMAIVHVHMARDLITMPAAWAVKAAKGALVVQTHGMIVETLHPLARPLDFAWTRRLLTSAKAVFYLTESERDSLNSVAGAPLRSHKLTNGVPVGRPKAKSSGAVEVLFLARLHPRKRPDFFVRASATLAALHPEVLFTLVGPDEGMGDQIANLIKRSGYSDRITWSGSLSPAEAVARIGRATIYVLPSVDEPFPMTVLEALSLGTPVIVTDTCGLAKDIADSGAGLVVDDSIEMLTSAIDRMLTNKVETSARNIRAETLATARFDIKAVVDELESMYLKIADTRGGV